MAVARDLSGGKNNVIAVIGDGAMSAGMAYEAMNNAGAMNSRLIVILNDNDMSIAPPVGAMSAYLSRLYSGKTYRSLREAAKQLGKHLPKIIANRANRVEEYSRGFMMDGGTLFEELGFYYVGPIDGHNLDHLLPVLKNVRDMETGPILVHVVTQKGKGYGPAEASADKYHAVVKFDVATGAQAKSKPNAPAYQNVFGQSLVKEAQKDDKIVGITAAMPSGTGIDIFAKAFPERTFDVGIAEQHAVTFAAGLATEGYKPFCAIYSTFLQRGYDQIVHDVAIQSLPVRFAIDRAGLVGADGATHAGSFDNAYLGCLPNFVIMAASDEAELVHMVATQVAINDRPSAVRYPRGEGRGVEMPEVGVPLEIGKGRIVREGTKIALLSFGTRLAECEKAADELAAHGLSTTIADARFMKPLDVDMVLKLAREHEILLTIEEGSIGGFGSHVMQTLAEHGMLDGGLRMRAMVLPDVFLDHDTPDAMYARAGLDAKGIVAKVFETLGKDFKAETASSWPDACACRIAQARRPLAGRARPVREPGRRAGRDRGRPRHRRTAARWRGRPSRSQPRGIERRAAGAPAHPFVSRGGVKLAGALEHYPIEIEGHVCLDVGASTGGFTEVLLANGAGLVFAVDVGRGQLHPSLHGHPRIVSMEETDIRELDGTRLPRAAGRRRHRRQLHFAEAGAAGGAVAGGARRCICWR